MEKIERIRCINGVKNINYAGVRATWKDNECLHETLSEFHSTAEAERYAEYLKEMYPNTVINISIEHYAIL